MRLQKADVKLAVKKERPSGGGAMAADRLQRGRKNLMTAH